MIIDTRPAEPGGIGLKENRLAHFIRNEDVVWGARRGHANCVVLKISSQHDIVRISVWGEPVKIEVAGALECGDHLISDGYGRATKWCGSGSGIPILQALEPASGSGDVIFARWC